MLIYAFYLLLLIIEHPLNHLEDFRMIIDDLDFLSDIEEFGQKVIGGARASSRTETYAGPGYASAKGDAYATGYSTKTRVDLNANVRDNNGYSYSKATANAHASSKDRGSSARSDSRSTSVSLSGGYT
jgi:hypothetical protein